MALLVRASVEQAEEAAMPFPTEPRRRWPRWSAFAIYSGLTWLTALAAHAAPSHGIAMHGTPKYPAGFTHFDYVNPGAPKGGRAAFGVQGSFDSLNPFIVKGNAAPGMRDYVFESLLARANDEPFSLYGLLAETVETPEDRSWVAFTLRPEARFSDGKPVTADDVIFSLELLREKAGPTTAAITPRSSGSSAPASAG